MNILHITSSYKPAYVYGGPTMSVSKLCENVARSFSTLKSGFRIEVLTTTANGPAELPVERGKATVVDLVNVTYFERITGDHSHFSPRLLLGLRNKIRAANGTRPMVHIHAWWNLVSVFSCMIALSKSCPVILSPRGTLSNYSFYNRTSLPKRLFHKVIGRHLLARCHFHVTTEKEKEDILKLVHPKGITVIPNFVELPHLHESVAGQPMKEKTLRPEPTKEARLLFLSRIEEKKGLELLFRALSLAVFPWTLTIAGDGKPEYVQQLKELAAALDLSSRLHWAGHLDNGEKFNVLRSHDLFVLPSHDENFANVVVESIAMGTPVLISNKVGLADYVRKHGLGMVCGLDPLAINDAMNKFFRGNYRFENRRFKERIDRDFNELQLTRQYISLYRSVVQ